MAIAFGLLGAAIMLKLPLCPFAFVTRHPCPGCGLTRATLALLGGDLRGAVALHPLSPIVAPLVALAFGYSAAGWVRGGPSGATKWLESRWVTRAGVALCVAMVLVWIARFFGAFGGPVPVNV